MNMKNVGPTFFQDYPNAICFNLVHLCPSMLLFPFAASISFCSTVLFGHFGCHEATSFCVTYQSIIQKYAFLLLPWHSKDKLKALK